MGSLWKNISTNYMFMQLDISSTKSITSSNCNTHTLWPIITFEFLSAYSCLFNLNFYANMYCNARLITDQLKLISNLSIFEANHPNQSLLHLWIKNVFKNYFLNIIKTSLKFFIFEISTCNISYETHSVMA